MNKKILTEVIAALLALLFLYAGFSKLVNMPAFTRAMHNQPFPSWFADALIWTIPPAEIIFALGLFFDRTRKYAAYAYLILMGLFSLYIAAILLHLFPRVPCSCGGVIQALSWGQHLLFNLCFTGLALAFIFLIKQSGTESRPGDGR
ncbi:MauE/DoxX family redox-associated membrane protein [Mucilaginibacter celer]|uniref:DoxX family membrane protein n=1 Tax=Mucilaginibacter celer TaxID=2305508 RepID=A0A494VTE1_9SPHI|nr:MauE/DoxX family redox-associated membrane protein [Mucilaginibacter celer]AYL94212.1 DoxX family membrane protein [Mucilaginibacter celer]